VAARAEACGSLMATVIFSIVVSLLMVTGPLYMLQVYDRVLGSRSEATLVALSVLVTFLFLVMGILEHARGRVMAIVGARFQDRLDRRVFVAAIQRSAVAPNDPLAIRAQRDLEAIRTFLASPVLLALMDVPWTPFFLAVIFVFHPMMGWLAVAGGVVLIVVTVLNQALSNAPQKEAGAVSTFSERMADQMKTEAETLQALGMTEAGFDRWQKARQIALAKGIAASRVAGGFASLTKTFRLFLQSAMLGLGA
jgi:ATP-binding cassette, subfamily C, bacterial